MCHISALWTGLVVSRRCTNVWSGRVVVYVCQQNRKRGEEGGRGAGMGPLKHESRRPMLPISCLHFISILLSVISALLKHPMKALPQINVCASLFFMGLKWGTLSARPPSFIPFFCSIPVSALRCHKRSYSLWFTLRFLRDGLGTPKRTMLVLVLLKEYISTRHWGKGRKKRWIIQLYYVCA